MSLPMSLSKLKALLLTLALLATAAIASPLIVQQLTPRSILFSESDAAALHGKTEGELIARMREPDDIAGLAAPEKAVWIYRRPYHNSGPLDRLNVHIKADGTVGRIFFWSPTETHEITDPSRR